MYNHPPSIHGHDYHVAVCGVNEHAGGFEMSDVHIVYVCMAVNRQMVRGQEPCILNSHNLQ